MFATHAADPEPVDAWTWIRRAALGLAVAIAVVASGVPVAADARAATLDSYRLGPDRGTCLTIVTCGPGTLPPGKVDPGPPCREADLPTPSAVVTRLGAVGTRSGQVLRLDIEVTNWKAYHETLFVSGRQYPACDAVGNRFRTWVDILDDTDGRGPLPVLRHRLSAWSARSVPLRLRRRPDPRADCRSDHRQRDRPGRRFRSGFRSADVVGDDALHRR